MFLRNYYRFPHNLKEIWLNPRQYIKEIQYRYQRMKRGWGDADTWSFDVYLARVITEGLTHLKEHQHILPNVWDTWEEYEAHTEEERIAAWHEVLDEMIEGFTLYYTVDWMESEHYEKFERALDLFKRHYYSLWD